ncbi:MAG TPA: hypothetical protein VLT89_11920 [Usitatibacter sp.]|nr:hypothetical protein [Usitatibacter sp.]
MKTRDEYVAQIKSDLDRWNAEAAKWEKHASTARKQYLDALNARREEAMYQLKLLQGASAGAWQDMAKGAEKALEQMKDAMAKARTHFEK